VAPGRVKAEVQGSRRTPYKVVLKVPPLFSEAIPRLSEALSHQALYVAQLLAGQMPPEIEKVFSAVGLSLFPTLARDLETSCTCPDWGNPCKHVAAVFYLLGEEFDRDPFQLFTLRGLSTEALLGSIQTSEPEEPDHPEPLDPTGFWGALDSELGRLAMPREASTPLPILQRLGPLPFWRGQDPLAVELGPDYATAAHRARNWFEGESGA